MRATRFEEKRAFHAARGPLRAYFCGLQALRCCDTYHARGGPPMNLGIKRFAALALPILLAVSSGCGKDDPVSPIGDRTAPTVTSTNPLNGATGVAVITATFSEPMTASTITSTNFTVTGPGATPV